ncbi:MAG: inorganic diphosphatase [Gemmatimonadota bacterium]
MSGREGGRSAGKGACSPAELPALDPASGHLNVVIDTPKGSRNKFKFDPEWRLFKLSGVLPAGAIFPYDFGFVPSTRGGDGDPLDVLVLMDEPAFVGCLVPARLLGVIEAEQTEKGETRRNDRLIAVTTESRNHAEVESLDDLSSNLLHEIEHFFVSYNAAKEKTFEVVRRNGPRRARAILAAGCRLQEGRTRSRGRR